MTGRNMICLYYQIIINMPSLASRHTLLNNRSIRNVELHFIHCWVPYHKANYTFLLEVLFKNINVKNYLKWNLFATPQWSGEDLMYLNVNWTLITKLLDTYPVWNIESPQEVQCVNFGLSSQHCKIARSKLLNLLDLLYMLNLWFLLFEEEVAALVW